MDTENSIRNAIKHVLNKNINPGMDNYYEHLVSAIMDKYVGNKFEIENLVKRVDLELRRLYYNGEVGKGGDCPL